ncbi:MAG: Lin0512 family protein [Pseudomonadota bacterium]
MARKSMVMEFGTGADIRGGDYTKAAVRALENALRHNSITFAQAFGMSGNDMQVTVFIGVAKPDQVDKAAVAAVLPYGTADVRVEEGGMDTPQADGSGVTILANAAAVVHLDLPDTIGDAR